MTVSTQLAATMIDLAPVTSGAADLLDRRLLEASLFVAGSVVIFDILILTILPAYSLASHAVHELFILRKGDMRLGRFRLLAPAASRDLTVREAAEKHPAPATP